MISSILDRRWTLPVLIALLLITFAVATSIDLGLQMDFANYYDAGSKIRYGEIGNLFDRFAWIHGHPPQGNYSFVAIPISAYLYVPMAMLSPRAAMLAFKFQNTLAYLAGFLLLFAHCHQFAGSAPAEQRRFATLFVLLALLYQPFWFGYRLGGQTTPTAFLCFVLALLCYHKEKYFLAALPLVFIIVIKPGFAIVVALLALLSGLRFLLYIATLSLAAGGLSLAVLGLAPHLEFLKYSKLHSTTPILFWGNSSFTLILENLRYWSFTHDRPGLVPVLDWARIAIALALAASFFWLVFQSRSAIPDKRGRLHFQYLAALCFGLMLLPVAWDHYLAIIFIPLAYIVACRREFSAGAMALVAAMVTLPVARNLVYVFWTQYHFDADSWPVLVFMGLSKSVPLLLMAVFIQRHYRSWFSTYARYTDSCLSCSRPS